MTVFDTTASLMAANSIEEQSAFDEADLSLSIAGRSIQMADPCVLDAGSYQYSLAAAFECQGIGVHCAAIVTMRVHPVPAGHGIIFVRTDLVADGLSVEEASIPALYDHVSDATLCTKISNADGVSVATVEHLMAAFNGLGIDNALIEVDAEELPIMDGSSLAFVNLIKQAGILKQIDTKPQIRILKPIRVARGDAYCELLPSEQRVFDVEIDFENNVIGRQSYSFNLDRDGLTDAVAEARTFCLESDVEKMHKIGLGKGGSLDNAVIVSDDQVLNEDGFRGADECVRHKLLDAIGDLHLAGGMIIGAYRGYKAGHALHNQLLRSLFAQPDVFEIVNTIPNRAIPSRFAAE